MKKVLVACIVATSILGSCITPRQTVYKKKPESSEIVQVMIMGILENERDTQHSKHTNTRVAGKATRFPPE